MMIPKLNNIDHVHIYVKNWDEAEQWYKTVLGFKRVESLMIWAVKNGPLTLMNSEGNIHLALFESEHQTKSTIAFGVKGEEFLNWKAHLERNTLKTEIVDHDLSLSLYFKDPFGNPYEITTYDYDIVKDIIQLETKI